MTDQYKELRKHAQKLVVYPWAKQALQLLDEMDAVGAGGVYRMKPGVCPEPEDLQMLDNTLPLQNWVDLINQATDDETKAILRAGLKEEIERIFSSSAERVGPVEDDGWIEWCGGECPVPIGTKVDVTHRSGKIYLNCPAGIMDSYAQNWRHSGRAMSSNIIAYRIVK